MSAKIISGTKELKTVRENTAKSILSQKVLKSFTEFLEVSELTLRAYKSGIKSFISFLRQKDIKTPKREDVQNYRKFLINCGRKPATVALYLSAIRRFFTWCEAEGLYPDITRGIKAPKQDKGHKKDFLDGGKIAGMLKGIDRSSLEGKRNFALLALMATCGLRTVEVVRANIEDIHTLGGVTVLNVQGKGRSDKKEFVKLSPQVEEAVRDYLSARGLVVDTEPLFASCSHRNCGHRLTTRTISGLCKLAMIKAGFHSSRLTAHSLRHSAVTLALLAGNSIADVQSFARHRSINTTMIYAHNVERITCEQSVSNAIFMI